MREIAPEDWWEATRIMAAWGVAMPAIHPREGSLTYPVTWKGCRCPTVEGHRCCHPVGEWSRDLCRIHEKEVEIAWSNLLDSTYKKPRTQSIKFQLSPGEMELLAIMLGKEFLRDWHRYWPYKRPNHDGRDWTLYRWWTADGELLYVGMSGSTAQRLATHSKDDTKPWTVDASNVTLEHFPDRHSLEEAEKFAIYSEHPKHNIVHAAYNDHR